MRRLEFALREIGARLKEISVPDIGVDLPRSAARVPARVAGNHGNKYVSI